MPTTNQTQHTPGPWEIAEESTRRNVIQIETLDAYAVCDVRNHNLSEQNAANARLISAAPELLKSLKCALHMIATGGYPHRPWHEEARAAIAKAESE